MLLERLGTSFSEILLIATKVEGFLDKAETVVFAR